MKLLPRYFCLVSRIVALGLILILFLPKLVNIGLLVDYQLNLAEYKVLCINKSQPELKCDGMCHLKTQIVEKSESPIESNPIEPRLNVITEFQLLFSIDVAETIASTQLATELFSTYHFSIQENDLFESFIPPKF